MKDAHPAVDAWEEWWEGLDALNTSLKRLLRRGTLNVKALPLREDAREVVQFYFRDVRQLLCDLSIDPSQISALDNEMQGIISMASKVTRAATYKTSIRTLNLSRAPLEIAIEIAAKAASQAPAKPIAAAEAAILRTLQQVVPTTALSYEQVLRDLEDPNRVSYRGTASELREVLRELLDHLAPDTVVLDAGVKLDQGLTRPTMKQKTVFILKARGFGDTQRKTATDATEAVEGAVGSLARSTYSRGSLLTHIGTTRQEVLTFKGYMEAVLAELLEIHKA